jgi:hypothetical protein
MAEQPESIPTSSTMALSPAPLPRSPAAFAGMPVATPEPESAVESSAQQSPPTAPSASLPASSQPQRIPRWLVRTELFLRVMLRMYIGLAVCYAPWSHVFWDQNPIFLQFPSLGIFATHGAVRGIISGLGLLNLWIAFQDALHHRNG